MYGTVVGVLRGGPSHEHEISLRSGHTILNNLPPESFTIRDIYIDKTGTWNERGRKTTPAQVLPSVDVIVNALHGAYGEDGEVQKLLERYGVPFTGSESFASFSAMHKILAKAKAHQSNIQTPKFHFIEREEGMDATIQDIVRNFLPPVVVKPVKGGSSVGITLATGYAPIHQAVTGLLAEPSSGGVLVEEYIRGKEISVGVIEQYRDEQLYTLPAIQLLSSDQIDSVICPAPLSKLTAAELARMARTMHHELGLRHYSRSDFMISHRGIFFLETNSLPGMTSESLFPKALGAVGVSLNEFVAHIIQLALHSRKRYSLGVPTMGR